MRFDRHDNGLWLPDLPRFVAGGRKQSLLGVTNLIGLGGGSSGPPLLTLATQKINPGAASTIVPNLSADIPAGSLIIVTATSNGAVTLSSVSDGVNTYVIDDAGTGSPCAAVASCANCGLVSSGTGITITFSGVSTAQACAVYYVTNCATSSPLDKKATATGTSTTPSSGATATTTNNFTAVVGCLGTTAGSTFTEDAAYTTNSNNSGTARLVNSNKTTQPIVAAAQTYAPSLGSSITWRCLVAAYKGLAG